MFPVTRAVGRERQSALRSQSILCTHNLPARSTRNRATRPDPAVFLSLRQSLTQAPVSFECRCAVYEENGHRSVLNSVQVPSVFWVPVGLRVRTTWRPSVSS